MKRLFRSLYARLNLWVLALCLVIFLFIALVFVSYSYGREEQSAMLYTSSVVDNVALRLDRKIVDIEESTASIAPLVLVNIDEPERMADIVERWVKSDTLISAGAVAFEPYFYKDKGRWFMEYVHVTRDRSVTHKRMGDEKYDYVERGWYKEAKARKNGLWVEPYFDVGGSQSYTTSYVMPILNHNGEVIAVLIADINLNDLVDAIHSPLKIAGSHVFFFTPKGVVITHDDKRGGCEANIYVQPNDEASINLHKIASELDTTDVAAKMVDADGDDVMVFSSKMKHLGWTLCAACGYDTVMSKLTSTTIVVSLIMLVGLLALAVCIRLILKRELSPLGKLASVARQIGRGKLNAELPSVEGSEELSSIHDSFVTMQKSLADYIRELRTTVAGKQRIESELQIARQIQQRMVPSELPGHDDLDIYAVLSPAKAVGGDFYEYLLRGDRLIFAIGDVSGKGVPAAMLMSLTRCLFRFIAHNESKPEEIMKLINNALSENNDNNMFATMFIGSLNIKTGVLAYCNAGHNSPIVLANDSVERLAVLPNLPIGVASDFQYHEQYAELGDNGLLLYTDGVTEAENADFSLFGEKRLCRVCREKSQLSATEIVNGITDAVKQHAGDTPQSDDIAILCIKHKTPTLTIANNRSELAKLSPFLARFIVTNNVDGAIANGVNLAIEEALVNAVDYAYAEDTQGEITLTAEAKDGLLCFTLTDHGVPFDPTTAPHTDTTLPAEEREVGGLGILLVKKLMDKVEYRREGDANILTLYKKTK